MIPNFDKTFDEIFNSKFNFNLDINQTDVQQIRNEDGSITLCIDAIGHSPDDIDIDVTSKSLKIKSEKPKSEFDLVKPINLVYKLGNNIDTDNIKAEFQNGLLILRIPIHGDTDTNTRKIKIKN